MKKWKITAVALTMTFALAACGVETFVAPSSESETISETPSETAEQEPENNATGEALYEDNESFIQKMESLGYDILNPEGEPAYAGEEKSAVITAEGDENDELVVVQYVVFSTAAKAAVYAENQQEMMMMQYYQSEQEVSRADMVLIEETPERSCYQINIKEDDSNPNTSRLIIRDGNSTVFIGGNEITSDTLEEVATSIGYGAIFNPEETEATAETADGAAEATAETAE